jgi:hypothetical protein
MISGKKFYVPGGNAIIKLYLRRTLVRSNPYSTVVAKMRN